MSPPPFTLDGYRDTIRGLAARGYAIADFTDVSPRSRDLILRHDIDQSIVRAHALATLEASEGWKATYFVLLRTEMYNPWSANGAQLLRDMLRMGHRIGLHLDATCYDDRDALEAGADAECRSLQDVIGHPVDMISFHRPARELLGGDRLVAGRLHTYMDRFTKEIGYSSDSRGEWRYGHPWDHDAVRAGRALQLLTHAVWWADQDELSPRSRLVRLLQENVTRLDTELASNSDIWKNSRSA
ncbi:hypothetical protein RPMA_09825 [Tardiphaga alba]|uniref:Polysaccharide deacetylase n=1 Tax=Tardiphaga alba TaxID=340268 RepID=A0ABX8A7V7_9BRAD|nr:hypothetical protein [Tardiphaga alba]QUS39101.1 hypothetical protein RPMA_09825 [Tardiphaga alba]